jgi:ribonuclease HI|tara:strand:- start:191 stop:628 length:438 start_codon:yes stop_codon:yes gene_type:complete
MIKIYTDGACSGNPGPGGWGYVVVENGKLHSSNGSESQTTNNRMELTAAIKALESARKDESLYLYTDSTYLQKGITEWIVNWKKNNWITSSKKPVSNKDLWIKIDQLNHELDIEWKWVKAHQSDNSDDTFYNNMADELATGAIHK